MHALRYGGPQARLWHVQSKLIMLQCSLGSHGYRETTIPWDCFLQVVLPLLQNEVVTTGWVSLPDFLTGLALVQAMPGPLFNFAAYLGRHAPSAVSTVALVVRGTPPAEPSLDTLHMHAPHRIISRVGCLPGWARHARGLKSFAPCAGAIIAHNAGYSIVAGIFICWIGLFAPGIILIFGIMPWWGRFRNYQMYRRFCTPQRLWCSSSILYGLSQGRAVVYRDTPRPVEREAHP